MKEIGLHYSDILYLAKINNKLSVILLPAYPAFIKGSPS